MTDGPRLETERLVLRMGVRADAPLTMRYAVENRGFLGPWEPARNEYYYTQDFWQRQIEANLLEWRQDRGLRLFLFERGEGERIAGILNVNNIVRGPAQYATLGYGLAEWAQGTGLMFEALSALIPYAFATLRLHRLTANYLPRNERSGKLLRRLNFVVEGYARDYLEINGRWEDHILTSRTNNDRPPD